MEWCEELLLRFQHEEGFSQHEMILKFRQLLTLSWIDLKKLKSFLQWLYYKRIHLSVMRDCFLHELIILEFYERDKSISINFVELCSQSIVQEMRSQADFILALSLISTKLLKNESHLHWKKIYDLILERYLNYCRETLSFFQKEIIMNRCVLIGGSYEEPFDELNPVIEIIQRELKTTSRVVESVSQIKHCYSNQFFFFELSCESLLSCCVHVIDLLSTSSLFQSFPPTNLNQLLPIFISHSLLSDLLLQVIEQLDELVDQEPAELERAEILFLDSIELLSWSSGLFFSAFHLFSSTDTHQFLGPDELHTLSSSFPTTICQDLAQRCLRSHSLELLNHLVLTKDRYQDFPSHHLLQFFFSGALIPCEALQLSTNLTLWNLFAPPLNPSLASSQYHIFFLASSCAHVNQILPTITLSDILFHLLCEQRHTDQLTTTLSVIFHFNCVTETETSTWDGEKKVHFLNLSILFYSLLHWWSHLSQVSSSSSRFPPMRDISPPLVLIFSLFASFNPSLLISLVSFAFEASYELRKWNLILDMTDQPCAYLETYCDASESLTASLVIALSSNDSPLRIKEVGFSLPSISLYLSHFSALPLAPLSLEEGFLFSQSSHHPLGSHLTDPPLLTEFLFFLPLLSQWFPLQPPQHSQAIIS
jgi:hypothetical protein